MGWNDVMSNVRQKLRRSFGRGAGEEVQVVTQGARLEQLEDKPLATPAADVFESDKELLIRADVPGGTPDGSVVAWEEGRRLTLLIKNQTLPAGTLWASEYTPHDWYCSFELPAYVDGAKATSSLKDGVLTVRIPKRAAVAKLIPVKAA